MAGTLWYRLKVDHVYQRRFGDSAALAAALGNSHWYLISRQPSVRIIPGSVRLDDDLLSAEFVTRDTLAGPERIHVLGSDFREMGTLKDFRAYEDGAYFSIKIGGTLYHGDAWALASLLSHAEPSVAKQEVLYVGQAFGPDGSSNAWERTRKHEKLQRIYEAHVNDDSEIFVAPLSLERGGLTGDDHIDDAEPGPSLDAYWESFCDMEGRTLKPAVDLIEHSLIAYFVPYYNDKLTEWRADKPTEAMQKMRSAGFRLLHVHLSGWLGLARFYSHQEPNTLRSHSVSQELPSSPTGSISSGPSKMKSSKWNVEALIAREGRDIFGGRGELADVTLRVFGDQAPIVRKPPGVILSRKTPEYAGTSRLSAHEEIRAAMREAKEAEDRANEPFLHSGHSSYDSSTGMVEIGRYLDDSAAVHVRLHDPESTIVNSVLIIGGPGLGKSNTLRVLIVEAFLARRFIVIPSDPTSRNNFLEAWSGVGYDDSLIASNLDDTIRNLAMARSIVEDRLRFGYHPREGVVSDILLAIDDADPVLQHDLGSRLIIDLLQRGGEVGVGLLLVISDMLAVEGNVDLMCELISCQSKLAFMQDGNYYIDELRAKYGQRRPETWRDDYPAFVLHCRPKNVRIEFLCAVFDSRASANEAKQWCEELLAGVGVPSIDWTVAEDEQDSWWTMEPLAVRFWALRRHQDAWALFMTISQMSYSEEVTLAKMIKWAHEAIEFRYSVKHGSWEVGPTTRSEGSLTLYADIKGQIEGKDTSDSIINMLLDMF